MVVPGTGHPGWSCSSTRTSWRCDWLVGPAQTVDRSTIKPERTVDLALAGSMTDYTWGVNGRTCDPTDPILVTEGEAIRLRMRNDAMMVRPMHIHGHTFTLTSSGVRKDTVLLPPMETVEVDVAADDPASGCSAATTSTISKPVRPPCSPTAPDPGP